MYRFLFSIVLVFIVFIPRGYSMTSAEEKMLFQTLGEIKGNLSQLNKRIDELREDMNARFKQIDKRFEEVDKRFEQIDKRFEQVDKRFEQVDRRFDEFFNYVQLFIVGVFGLLAVFAGLVVWDRRTAIKQTKADIYRDMNKELAPERFIELSKEVSNLIKALNVVAEKNIDVRVALQDYNLLLKR